MVDKFTKYAHFITLTYPYIAQKVVEIFLEGIYKLYGLPESIVSDRDKIFTNNFWQHLFKALGTQLDLSNVYHPQSDGLTERLNQSLEMYLRCFVSSRPHK